MLGETVGVYCSVWNFVLKLCHRNCGSVYELSNTWWHVPVMECHCFYRASGMTFLFLIGANQELLDRLYDGVFCGTATKLCSFECYIKSLFLIWTKVKFWVWKSACQYYPYSRAVLIFQDMWRCLLTIAERGWAAGVCETPAMVIISVLVLFLIVFWHLWINVSGRLRDCGKLLCQ